MERNDSLFSYYLHRIYDDSTGNIVDEEYFTRLEYFPLPSEIDTLFPFRLDLAITRLSEPYSTPAGTFSGCILFADDFFELPYGSEMRADVVSPGKGIVGSNIYLHPVFFRPGYLRKSRLVGYELKE